MHSLKNMHKSNLETRVGPLWLKVEAGVAWAPRAHRRSLIQWVGTYCEK